MISAPQMLSMFASLVLASPANAFTPLDAVSVNPIKFQHRLRVCNAYPSTIPLHLFRGAGERLTDVAMPYKTCRDFATQLRAGEELDFRPDFGSLSAGTFTVSALPGNSDSLLLLVLLRESAQSPTVAFESHVFANLLNAQIALIDAYRGPHQNSTVGIRVAGVGQDASATNLKYGSVVAVNPGHYECFLTGAHGDELARAMIAGEGHETYVALRVGVNGPSMDQAFPQELVLYPRSSNMDLPWQSMEFLAAPSACAAIVVVAGAVLVLAVRTVRTMSF